MKEEIRKPISEQEQALFGIEKLNCIRSELPAITHVDYSARVQTITPEQSPRYHRIISAFDRLTGCPVLVNTSFNIRGEPHRVRHRRRLPLLHVHRHGGVGGRELPVPQGKTAPDGRC